MKVHAFICTRVDFSNSLLYGTSACLLDRLQSVLNSAARLILRIGKYDPISAAIRRDLHWLPVPFRIQYKFNSITRNCLAGHAPEYLIELCHSVNNHSSKAQPSVVVSGSAPGPSISEGTIWSTRLLRLLTTAVELTSYRHPTSTQRTSTLPEEAQNSLHATVHVMPLRIDVNSVISTTTTVVLFSLTESMLRPEPEYDWLNNVSKCITNDDVPVDLSWAGYHANLSMKEKSRKPAILALSRHGCSQNGCSRYGCSRCSRLMN